MPKKFNPKTFRPLIEYCPLCKLEIHPSKRCQLTMDTERCPHCKAEFSRPQLNSCNSA